MTSVTLVKEPRAGVHTTAGEDMLTAAVPVWLVVLNDVMLPKLVTSLFCTDGQPVTVARRLASDTLVSDCPKFLSVVTVSAMNVCG
jgi:hypothetical protein